MEGESSSCSAMDNSFSAESSGKNVIEWKSKPCKHLQKGIDLEKMSIQIAKFSLLQCQGCAKQTKGSSSFVAPLKKDKKGKGKISGKKSGGEWPRTWVCLACGLVGCGNIVTAAEGMGTGHAWSHWLYVNHPYALQCGEDLACWCFPCCAYLEFRFVEPDNLEEGNQGLLMIGPSASPEMLQALKVVQEKLRKESARFREIRLNDVVVEKKPVEEAAMVSEVGGDGGGGRRIVRGLVNLGNTCFFNSVVQNLLAIGVLQEHFSKPAPAKEGHLTSCLRKLYADMISEGQAAKDAVEDDSNTFSKFTGKGRVLKENRDGSVRPSALFAAVCEEAPCFKGFQQQDSQELLLFLLNGLNAEELSAKKMQSSSSEMFDENGNSKTKVQVDSNGQNSNDGNKFASFIYNVFGSELSSTICCTECGHSSVSYETFFDLSLAIPSKPKPPKLSSCNPRPSTLGLGKGLTKAYSSKYGESQKEGQRKEGSRLGSAMDKTELVFQAEEMSSSFSDKSKSSRVDTKTPSISEVPCDFLWMDYLDTPAQSTGVSQGILSTTEIRGVPAHDEPSLDMSEMTSTGQLSDSETALNQNAIYTQGETSATMERKMSTTEGDVGINGVQDVMLVSDFKDHHETVQQEETLRMIGDSEVLLLPYKYPTVAYEGTETVEYIQKLTLVSTDETLLQHSGNEATSGIDNEVIDGDLDGFAEMFNEEETSVFEKSETEAAGSFLSNEVNSIDDLWETELADNTEDDIEINKEDPDNILLMTIDGCLTDFTKPELLSGENGWECERCYKILNNSFKECMGVLEEENKLIQYKQTVKTTTNERGTFEEQVHLVNGGGSISVWEGAIDTNFNKLPVKQVINSEDLSMFKCNGMSNSEGNIHKYHHLKGLGKRENSNTNPSSLNLTKMDDNMYQHVARFSNSDTNHSLESSSDIFYGKGNCCDIASKIMDEKLIDMKAETNLENDKAVPNIHTSRHIQIEKSKQSCLKLERENFDSQYCRCDVDKLQNGALTSSCRDIRLAGSHSKENEPQLRRLKQNATKVLQISKAPLVLTIHLKRFGQDMLGRLNKLSGHVTFCNRLDLRPFLDPSCPDKERCIYHLIGVVEHSGSMRGGHYVAYVRGPKDESSKKAKNDDGDPDHSIWYSISDSFVRKLPFSEVLQSEAYLLFYEKDVS